MKNFKPFAQTINARLTELSKHELYTTVKGDYLWHSYLGAFPEGTDPVYKTNTEHNCNCCKNFVRNFGPLVAIIDGKKQSIWAVKGLEYPYNVVAERLNDLVSVSPITGVFRTVENSYGAEQTTQLLEDKTTIRWNHFYGKVAKRHFNTAPDAARGEINTSAQVFERGLNELTADALSQVVELIESNNLYRGAEHLAAVKAFQALHRQTPTDRNLFIWQHANNPSVRFRNTVIGTLVDDLSNGIGLEAAVRSFEAKVAPTNYKRTSALITPGMVADAMKTINTLGLESALERRHARLSDISVNNVLWVDNDAKAKMKGGIESLLMAAAATPEPKGNAQDISIDEFLATIMPQATSMAVLVKNSQQNKFMSLTAPVHTDVEPLFKWGNNFAWSYDGNVADSIKERVKKAGGAVTGDLCCRLAWNNTDDLDFHMTEPGGYHIYFSNRMRLSGSGGVLDLDANGLDGMRTDPAENIVYAKRTDMRDGFYDLSVKQFSKRNTDNFGFEVEVEFESQTHVLSCPRALHNNETVPVARIIKSGDSLAIAPVLPSTTASKEKWGVTTETFTKVNTVLYSPNYWDDNHTGNRHVFFILDGCASDATTRGIYNEFLTPALEKHRKVFEVLGSRTQCPATSEQLSGVGFSSTNKDEVVVRVATAKSNRVYNVKF